MNRIISSIYTIILLGVIIESLDAWKLGSVLKNNQKQMGKLRYKRQYGSSPFSSPNGCSYSEDWNCPAAKHVISNAYRLHLVLNHLVHQNLFANGLTSMSALQNGGMCFPNTNLLTSNAFSALHLGHLTLPQLIPFGLFPVKTLDLSTLINYNYIITIGQINLLSGLGIQAVISGHITMAQLQPLNLHPLDASSLSLDVFVQAQYLTEDCILTALGISAERIGYLTTYILSSLNCPMSDYSQASIIQLIKAKYVHPSSNILTTVGIAALGSHYFSQSACENLGLYPFNDGSQIPSTDSIYREQPIQNTIGALIQAGHFYQNYLITAAGYHAYLKGYFKMDSFRRLNLWPYPGTLSLSALVTAGYASHTGHLTMFGISLFHEEYFSSDSLAQIGIHFFGRHQIFHHALRYGGYLQSQYHEIQSSQISFSANPTDIDYSAGVSSQQVAGYIAGAVSTGNDNTL